MPPNAFVLLGNHHHHHHHHHPSPELRIPSKWNSLVFNTPHASLLPIPGNHCSSSCLWHWLLQVTHISGDTQLSVFFYDWLVSRFTSQFTSIAACTRVLVFFYDKIVFCYKCPIWADSLRDTWAFFLSVVKRDVMAHYALFTFHSISVCDTEGKN